MPSPSIDDASRLILAIAAERSEQAFSDLFDLYAGRLKYFFARGGIEVDRAEELAQDVLLVVWRRAESFDPARSSASTWLYALARNRRIDEYRLRGRSSPRAEDLAWDSVRDDAPGSDLDAFERREALARAIVALPEEQRAVLECTFFEGKSLSEVATLRGLPLGTVKSRARLALERLRKALHPQHQFPHEEDNR